MELHAMTGVLSDRGADHHVARLSLLDEAKVPAPHEVEGAGYG
jgi:hypothetical protein